MSYILSLKEKKLLQTENFQSLGWVKFRPFKSRIASYHKSQLFFRTGERFKPSNKFYAQVYLFSDTFQKDGRDFQMKVFVKVPCRFIWASDRSKRVSIIVPTNFKFYTTVKVYDPLHLQMVKGLELHPDEAYPVEKIARKGYWGKVYPHLKKNYEEVYNKFTETEKVNANIRVLENEVLEPHINEVLEERSTNEIKPTVKAYDRSVESNVTENNQITLAQKELMDKHLELEKLLQERIENEKKKLVENNNLELNENLYNPSFQNNNIKEVEKEYVVEEKEDNFTPSPTEEGVIINEDYGLEEDSEKLSSEEPTTSLKEQIALAIQAKKEKELYDKQKQEEREIPIRMTPTPDLNERKKRDINIKEEDIKVAIDENFVDEFEVDSDDEEYTTEYQEYDPIEFDEEIDEDFVDLDEEYEDF